MQGAIAKWGHKIPKEEVAKILAAADVDGDGTIDYNEFVAATINVNQLEKEDLILKAFRKFDTDGSDSISMQELEVVRPAPSALYPHACAHKNGARVPLCSVYACVCTQKWCAPPSLLCIRMRVVHRRMLAFIQGPLF